MVSVLPGRGGGCQCGAIRYRLLRAPVALYACHCRDCQKQSASGFGMSMWVERDAIEFSGSSPRFWRTRGDSGLAKQCAFCAECGTRLYHAGDDESEPFSMKAGTLDDTSDLWPTCHLWTKRAQPWMAPILEASACFEGEPDDDETLRAQWRETAPSSRREAATSTGAQAPVGADLVRRFYADIWEVRDESAFAELLHEDFTFRGSLGHVKHGREAFAEYVDMVHSGLQDYRCVIEELICEGDKAAARMTFHGVHRGELIGYRPTGKRVSWEGCAVFALRDGRIAELWVLGDLKSLEAQLGSH